MYDGKNVLVTGASGLIGRALVQRLLDLNAQVRATVFQRDLDLRHHNLEVIRCNLLDDRQCLSVTKDIDVVFHCAAFIRGAKGQIDEGASITINNLIPTIKIANASCVNKVQKFGFVSSSTIYPDVTYPVKETEGFDADPSPCYFGVGWMKRYCEKFCEYCHSEFSTDFGIIRTTAIYGPNDNFLPSQAHVIPSLIVKVDRQDNPLQIWGDGLQVRDFIYVDDVVDALIQCVEKHAHADAINIATGTKTTVKQLVSTLVELEGYYPNIVYQTDMPSMIGFRLVDIQKAIDCLGWKSSVDLRSGLSRTLEWYKANRENKHARTEKNIRANIA